MAWGGSIPIEGLLEPFVWLTEPLATLTPATLSATTLTLAILSPGGGLLIAMRVEVGDSGVLYFVLHPQAAGRTRPRMATSTNGGWFLIPVPTRWPAPLPDIPSAQPVQPSVFSSFSPTRMAPPHNKCKRLPCVGAGLHRHRLFHPGENRDVISVS